jgi:hypothetical protein
MSGYAIGGQSSGDFRETSGRVQILHVVTRNSVGVLTTDAFTQANPPVVPDAKALTLVPITKVGVLGGSVAFTRPEIGNGFHGGATKVGGNYSIGLQPLGIFINDAIGNAFENTPGIASGRGPYICGNGSTLGISIYESKVQVTAGPNTKGDPLPAAYAPGQKVYASVNGLLTNLLTDAYEYNVATNPAPIVIGIVKVAPDANSSLLVIDLRV